MPKEGFTEIEPIDVGKYIVLEPRAQIVELEPTDDGQYIVTARGIQHARQAFLDGDLDPLLKLVAFHGREGDPETAPHPRSYFHGKVLFSPLLAALLTDVLTGTIKRPRGQGVKKILMSRGAIMVIGQEIDRLRANHEGGGMGMSREGAIQTVAEGSPAIEGLEGLEGLEIPKVPKDQIKRAYKEFERLFPDREKPFKPTRARPSRKKPSTKKKPTTATRPR